MDFYLSQTENFFDTLPYLSFRGNGIDDRGLANAGSTSLTTQTHHFHRQPSFFYDQNLGNWFDFETGEGGCLEPRSPPESPWYLNGTIGKITNKLFPGLQKDWDYFKEDFNPFPAWPDSFDSRVHSGHKIYADVKTLVGVVNQNYRNQPSISE
mgnify:FL=1